MCQNVSLDKRGHVVRGGRHQGLQKCSETIAVCGPAKMGTPWATHDLASDVKAPRMSSMRKLKRVVRYMKGTNNQVIWVATTCDLGVLGVRVDVNFANDKRAMVSRTEIVITNGGSVAYSASRNHHAVSLYIYVYWDERCLCSHPNVLQNAYA